MTGVIIDDAQLREDGNLVGSQWTTQTNATDAHNGTISSCRPDTSNLPYIHASFFGSEISLVGRPTAGLKLNYTVDGSEVRSAILNTDVALVGKDGVVLWTLDGLDDDFGSHFVQIYPVSGEIQLDYVTYLPSNRIPQTRDIVMVDDQDPFQLVDYFGSWSRETSASIPASGSPPAMNGTYSYANTNGASFSVNFTGDAVGVHGMLNSVRGKLVASYAVDNRAPVNVTHFNGSQTVDANNWDMNRAFHDENLGPGHHTLTVTVSEVTGDQGFYFDYMTYKTTPPTSILFVSALFIPSSSSSGPTINIGAIVGAIVGFTILVYILRMLMRRRRSLAVRQQPLVPIRTGQSWQPPPPPWSPPHRGEEAWQAPPPMPQPQPWRPPSHLPAPTPTPFAPAPALAPWQRPPSLSSPRNTPLQPEVGVFPNPTVWQPPLSPPPTAAMRYPPAFPPPAGQPPTHQDDARSELPEFLEPMQPGQQQQIISPGPPEPGAGLPSPPQLRNETPVAGTVPTPSGNPPPYVG